MNSKALPGNFVSGIGCTLPPAMWWWMKTLWLAWKNQQVGEKKAKFKYGAHETTQARLLCLTLHSYEIHFSNFTEASQQFYFCLDLWEQKKRQAENTSGGAVLAQVFSTRETGWVPEQAWPTPWAQCWGLGEAERLNVFNDLTPVTHNNCLGGYDFTYRSRFFRVSWPDSWQSWMN